MSDRRVRAAIAVLALVGAGIAGYLVYVHARGLAPVCTRGGGCEKVQSSSYSEVAGIPVATLGLLAYLTIFATALVRAPAAGALGLAVSLSGAAFALYLLVVQIAVIEAICIWCVASDVVIGLLAVLAVARIRTAD